MPSLERWLAAALIAASPGVGLAAAEPPASRAPVVELPLLLSAQLRSPERVVLIDVASAQLFMVEHGQIVESMRVIVGGPKTPTPSFRSMIRDVTLNPYWNVPPELAQSTIAPRVIRRGAAYLRQQGYEVVSEIGPQALVLAPESVDWKAVAAGTREVQLRQLPRLFNSMGKMKFDIANAGGIFLHDTPDKTPFAAADRSRSHGCVRLEDAPRFARWLFGRDPEASSSAPEQRVPLPAAVPIIITYLDTKPAPATSNTIAEQQPAPALLKATGAEAAMPDISTALPVSRP